MVTKECRVLEERSQCIYVHAIYHVKIYIANCIAVYSSKNFFLHLQDR